MAARKVEVLRELQEVDSALDQIRARAARIAEAWGNRAPLETVTRERDAAHATLRQAQAAQRDLDLQLEKLRAKVRADSEKLYSGRVRNPRELQDLQAEVEQDQRLISSLEDRTLAQMDVVEAAQHAAAAADAQYTRAEEAWRRDQLALRDEHATLKQQSAELLASRQALVQQADPAALRTYEALRRSKGGLAVARVFQHSCQGCRVTIPTSEEQRARTSTELVFCSSCGRILYAS